ncbi:ankyrin-1-like isoform X4 [Chrysoperla carnea]|uniref:ankyrin-1-like isoform X4 n=1 Tax=Chrysoperla carnea TaxID=189513 RepID=UPI001D06FA6B|nr:ankyrin-1-like isoform X4 [Chrysoperla carnea]
MDNRDIRCRLINAIRNGELETARELINSYGLPYLESLSKGYDLLCDALVDKHSEIAKLLLTSGSEVNSYQNSSNTPLHFAVKNGDIEIIKMLLVRGANINAQNIFGVTPLHEAIENNDQEIIELLLKHEADVNVKNRYGRTPLYDAIKNNRLGITELLLKHEADVNVKNWFGQTPLYNAIQNNRLEITELLLKHKSDINAIGIDRKTPLFNAIEKENLKITKLLLDNGANVKDFPKLLNIAVNRGCTEIVELLLQHNANVNVKNRYGQTPLYDAIQNNRLEITELLLKHKSDINAEGKNRKTPLFYAIENQNLKITKLLLDNGANVKDYPELLNIAVKRECPEIVELLLQHNADVNATDINGNTALLLTVSDCYEDSYKSLDRDSYVNIKRKITKLLLNHGANVDAQTRGGKTPLHFAVYNGYSQVVEVLLEYNANVNVREKKNLETPLHMSARRKNVEICKILLNKGVDVDAGERNGFTALHIATHLGHVKTVTTLLEYGCDINSRDQVFNTALHIASHLGHVKTVTTLLEYGSDINIMTRRYLTPLEYAKTAETIEILKRHIVQMKTANLYVSQRNLLSVDGISFPDFQEKCENEITSMKSEKMNNYNISFYDILTKNTDSLAICLRNENIVQILKLDDYKTKFPIYGSMIKSRFRNGMKRKELLDQGNKILHFLFAYYLQLPQECTEKIFSYLSDEDLKIIIEKIKDK